MTRPLLEVNNLTTRFRTERGTVTAVDDVSFHVDPGETLAIVGESGSGKSVTALSVLRLIPNPPGRIESGEILFDGVDLVKLDDPGIRGVRGNKIAMIFQEPMSSLNPALTVGLQVAEPINVHRGTPWGKAYEAATELIGHDPGDAIEHTLATRMVRSLNMTNGWPSTLMARLRPGRPCTKYKLAPTAASAGIVSTAGAPATVTASSSGSTLRITGP